MDQNTHQSSAKPAGPSDTSSTTAPRESLGQEVAAADTPVVVESAPATVSAISRWSEGTFGSATASQSSSEKQGSSTYSGKSAEATVAQAAAPTLVDTGRSQRPAETMSDGYIECY